MFFKQIVHADLGCASYVVGSSETGECVVVDPRWEVEPYIELAADHGFRIAHIIETHTHADHVSGHGRLAAVTDAPVCIYENAGVAYPHHDLSDGDIITCGEIRLHVIHTPGHRPEHISIAVEDSARGEEPWIILSGDSLFVGDVARPDLAVEGREGARLLFHSLHTKLAMMPDFAAVYPAHVAGSLCGRVSSDVSSTTMGYERRYNAALTIADESAFVTYMNERLPQRPPNMARIVELNRGAFVIGESTVNQLHVSDEALSANRCIVDVRPSEVYLLEHIPGSLHISVTGAQFGTRAGFVLPPGQELVLVASDPGEAQSAAESLRVVAFDHIAGYILFEDWLLSGRTTVTIGEVSPKTVNDDSISVVDVREPDEWVGGTVAGAILIPYRELASRTSEVGSDRRIAVACATGGRSAVAASVLERAGFTYIENLDGGMSAWEAEGLPMVSPTLDSTAGLDSLPS